MIQQISIRTPTRNHSLARCRGNISLSNCNKPLQTQLNNLHPRKASIFLVLDLQVQFQSQMLKTRFNSKILTNFLVFFPALDYNQPAILLPLIWLYSLTKQLLQAMRHILQLRPRDYLDYLVVSILVKTNLNDQVLQFKFHLILMLLKSLIFPVMKMTCQRKRVQTLQVSVFLLV